MEIIRTNESCFDNLPEYPFQPNYIEIDGIRIHYVDVGRENGITILLLHGVPTWSFLYREIIPILNEAGYRVVVPDLPGFGKSDKPLLKEWYNLSNLSGVIAQLIQRLNLRNIVLFGQDWGSMIGLRTFLLEEDRFIGVIISNGGLPGGNEKVSLRFRLWKFFAMHSPYLPVGRIVSWGSINRVSKKIRKAYDAPFTSAQHKISIRTLPDRVPVKPDTAEAALNSAALVNLSKIHTPFLTFFGDSDPITAGWNAKFIDLVPGATEQKHEVIKAGHFIQEDEGREVASKILNFIKDNNLEDKRE